MKMQKTPLYKDVSVRIFSRRMWSNSWIDIQM